MSELTAAPRSNQWLPPQKCPLNLSESCGQFPSIRVDSGVKLLQAFCAFAAPAIHAASAQLPRQSVSKNDNALVAAIPFAADAGTSILLSVSMNRGIPEWWALDSGASECIVDRSV